MLDQTKAKRIRDLNDACRSTFTRCSIVMTAALMEVPPNRRAGILKKVRELEEFNDDNDPYHEHDMAFFEDGGERFFFKFDYFDVSLEHGSDDPSDEEKTRRVLTIGFASDY